MHNLYLISQNCQHRGKQKLNVKDLREQYPMLNFYLPRNLCNAEIGSVDKPCKKKGTSIELVTILYSVTVYNMLIWWSDN